MSVKWSYCARDMFTARQTDGNWLNIVQYCPMTIQYTVQHSILLLRGQYCTLLLTVYGHLQFFSVFASRPVSLTNTASVFRRIQKCKKRLLVSSCPSGCLSAWNWNDFHEIWYFSVFRKTVDKCEVSFKSDKNNGYWTWELNSSDNISLSSSKNEKCFEKSCRGNQNTHFVFINYFSKIVPFVR